MNFFLFSEGGTTDCLTFLTIVTIPPVGSEINSFYSPYVLIPIHQFSVQHIALFILCGEHRCFHAGYTVSLSGLMSAKRSETCCML